jgi:hypothetical protein
VRFPEELAIGEGTVWQGEAFEFHAPVRNTNDTGRGGFFFFSLGVGDSIGFGVFWLLFGPIPPFLLYGGKYLWTARCGMACLGLGTRREFCTWASRRLVHRECLTLALLQLYYRYARRKSTYIHPDTVRKKIPLDVTQMLSARRSLWIPWQPFNWEWRHRTILNPHI